VSDFQKLTKKEASEIHFSLTRGEYNTANYLLNLYFLWSESEEGEEYWVEFSDTLFELSGNYRRPEDKIPFRLALKLQDLKDKMNEIMCEEEITNKEPKLEPTEGEYLERAKDRLISHLMDELAKVNQDKVTKIDEDVRVSQNLMMNGWD
jgi:hypothetical protein